MHSCAAGTTASTAQERQGVRCPVDDQGGMQCLSSGACHQPACCTDRPGAARWGDLEVQECAGRWTDATQTVQHFCNTARSGIRLRNAGRAGIHPEAPICPLVWHARPSEIDGFICNVVDGPALSLPVPGIHPLVAAERPARTTLATRHHGRRGERADGLAGEQRCACPEAQAY